MPAIRTLLAATDQSAQADQAVKRALLLEQQLNARLIVMQAVADEPLWWIVENSRLDPEQQRQKRRAETSQALNKRISQLAAETGSTISEDSIRVRSGKPHQEIKAQAQKILADLLILGAHGKSQLRDWLVGTTAERVIQSSTQSVLVVKNTPKQHYQNVMVAVDFSEVSRHAIEQAAALAPQAKLHIVHVLGRALDEQMEQEQPAESEYAAAQMHAIEQTGERLDAFIADCAVNPDGVQRHVLLGHPPVAIMQLAEELGAELLATGSHGLDAADRIFMGHVAQAALRRAKSDVLIIRLPPEQES